MCDVATGLLSMCKSALQSLKSNLLPPFTIANHVDAVALVLFQNGSNSFDTFCKG